MNRFFKHKVARVLGLCCLTLASSVHSGISMEAGLDRFQKKEGVKTLTFSNTDTNEVLLDNLNQHSDVEEIFFPGGGTQMTGDCISHLSDLKELRHLSLCGQNVTDETVSGFGSLTKLTGLDLYHTSVTDFGLASISTLTNLQVLSVSGSCVSGTGVVQCLSPLKNLQFLEAVDTNPLSGEKLTYEHIEQLKTCIPGLKLEGGLVSSFEEK